MNASNDPDSSGNPLSHVDGQGRARMVDVSGKETSVRVARAQGRIRLTSDVRCMLLEGRLPKGEALGVARIAGIQAAKETWRLVPLCHQIPISQVVVDFEPVDDDALVVTAEARSVGATGVEMEALTAVTVAALTVYDMVKAVHRGAVIERVELVHKSGGNSGTWDRESEDGA